MRIVFLKLSLFLINLINEFSLHLMNKLFYLIFESTFDFIQLRFFSIQNTRFLFDLLCFLLEIIRNGTYISLQFIGVLKCIFLDTFSQYLEHKSLKGHIFHNLIQGFSIHILIFIHEQENNLILEILTLLLRKFRQHLVGGIEAIDKFYHFLTWGWVCPFHILSAFYF